MILDIAISLIAVLAFAAVFVALRIVPVAQGAMSAVTAGLGTMLDSDLNDAQKEVAVRRAGLSLIVAAFNMFWRFGFALIVAGAPILLADAVGLAASAEVFALMLRWEYIVIVTVVVIVASAMIKRWRASGSTVAGSVNRYSTADRFFHMLAFSSPAVLRTASIMEDRLRPNATTQPTGPPIFVTSLARGGTTALLNALHDVPSVATHTYRDMPFLTAPSLWSSLAGRRKVERYERAHGDGLEIDLDTPEAFEEVIWRMYWPEKYRSNGIDLWRPNDRKPDGEAFLARHMEKIIFARQNEGSVDAAKSRYASKNNANVARIPYLAEGFQDCSIVVPVRRPQSHAASLLRQHLNFLKLHREDDFVRRYMRDIGHFEFGDLHRPMQFPGFNPSRYDPLTRDYWLHYWIQAFQEVLRHQDKCIFVTQDDLREDPQRTMAALCEDVSLDPGPLGFASYFRSGPDNAPEADDDPNLVREANEVYRACAAAARRSSL